MIRTDALRQTAADHVSNTYWPDGKIIASAPDWIQSLEARRIANRSVQNQHA
jgi:hypothetical protein